MDSFEAARFVVLAMEHLLASLFFFFLALRRSCCLSSSRMRIDKLTAVVAFVNFPAFNAREIWIENWSGKFYRTNNRSKAVRVSARSGKWRIHGWHRAIVAREIYNTATRLTPVETSKSDPSPPNNATRVNANCRKFVTFRAIESVDSSFLLSLFPFDSRRKIRIVAEINAGGDVGVWIHKSHKFIHRFTHFVPPFILAPLFRPLTVIDR